MTKQLTVAIDVMSGDAGPDVTLEAVCVVLSQRSDIKLLLVGDPSIIEAHMSAQKVSAEQFEIVPAAQVVTMEDSAAVALRNKKQSSMRLSINLVKEGTASACVSSGNTGALLAISKFVLKTLPGIDRPAICTTIPAMGGHTHMLDLGANIDCSAEQLFQFATMGSILAQAIDGIEQPKVGLLNIGSEDIKGNTQVKEAAVLLQNSPLNYIGFVEGNEIFAEKVDVVVCDGFVGNVALKTCEGVARMVSHYMKEEFNRTPINKVIGLIAKPVLKAFGRRIDPRRYNGASLLGLQGVVVKSHGSADALAFANAINIAILEIDKDVPSNIAERMSQSVSVA